MSLQNGRGFATVNSNAGSGSSFGKVGNGRITIVDAPRGAETKVTVRNCDQIRRPNRRTTVCIGDGIGFSLVNGIWKVTLKGRGINASAVATGSLRLKGTRGRFSIDYGDYRSWPRVARTYRLG